MQTTTIPAYLYQQYYDDKTLQAFVNSYNTLTQEYVDWFVNASLPDYTNINDNSLLDWVGLGLYGVQRPTLTTTFTGTKGTFSSITFASGVPYAGNVNASTQSSLVSNDVYKRIITWHFYKGDGQLFNIHWLKKRIIRFLFGTSGNDVLIQSVYGIGVTMSMVSGQQTITITLDQSKIYQPFYDQNGNTVYGNFGASAIGSDILPMANILQQALNSGVCQLPFIFSYIVTIL